MKKTYEEPKIEIELFSGQDVIVCSIGMNPEDPGDPSGPVFGDGYRDDA